MKTFKKEYNRVMAYLKDKQIKDVRSFDDRNSEDGWYRDIAGNIIHVKNSKLHSIEDLPAHIDNDKNMVWFDKDKLHRLNKPAFIGEFKKDYWFEDKHYTKNEFKNIMRNISNTESVKDFFNDKLSSGIYISGAITNNTNWENEFLDAHKHLVNEGYDVIVNPYYLSKEISNFLNLEIEDIDYQTFLNYDLYMLTRYCDKIYMLKGWEKSKGALIEFLEAKNQNMKIIFES